MLAMDLNGTEIKLTSDVASAKIKICEEEIDVAREAQKGNSVMYAQLFRIEEGVYGQEQHLDPKIYGLLKEFSSVFEEPTSLPPKRSVDHKIELKPGAKPINQRPYRFFYFQKLEIEKIV